MKMRIAGNQLAHIYELQIIKLSWLIDVQR